MKKYANLPVQIVVFTVALILIAGIVFVQGLVARWVVGMFWDQAYAYSPWAYGLAMGLLQSIFGGARTVRGSK